MCITVMCGYFVMCGYLSYNSLPLFFCVCLCFLLRIALLFFLSRLLSPFLLSYSFIPFVFQYRKRLCDSVSLLYYLSSTVFTKPSAALIVRVYCFFVPFYQTSSFTFTFPLFICSYVLGCPVAYVYTVL
jgi:hypothetical protein